LSIEKYYFLTYKLMRLLYCIGYTSYYFKYYLSAKKITYWSGKFHGPLSNVLFSFYVPICFRTYN
jgi:hypothetical protein